MMRSVIFAATPGQGLRNLEREPKIARKTVTRLVSGEADSVTVGQSLEDFLGVRKFRFGEIEEEDPLA